jgi:hypothetical protein
LVGERRRRRLVKVHEYGECSMCHKLLTGLCTLLLAGSWAHHLCMQFEDYHSPAWRVYKDRAWCRLEFFVAANAPMHPDCTSYFRLTDPAHHLSGRYRCILQYCKQLIHPLPYTSGPPLQGPPPLWRARTDQRVWPSVGNPAPSLVLGNIAPGGCAIDE